MRYVIEGEWSGYTSAQRRVCHRKLARNEKHAEAVRKLRGITFTDGTWLSLRVREAKPRERVEVIDGYSSLIDDCIHHGVSSVAELPRSTM